MNPALVDLRDRHLDFYVDFARNLDAERAAGRRDVGLVDAEIDNVRTALTWALERGRIDDGLELASVVFDDLGPRRSEGRSWLERLLAAGSGSSPHFRGRGEHVVSDLHFAGGDYGAAFRHAAAAVDLFDECGDDRVGGACARAGWSLWYAGRVDEADGWFHRAIDVLRRGGRPTDLEFALRGLAWVHISRDEFDQALGYNDEGARVVRASGDRYALIDHLWSSAGIFASAGELDAQNLCFEEAIALCRELDYDLASGLCSFGSVLLRYTVDLERASSLFAEAATLARSAADVAGETDAMVGLVSVAAQRRDLAEARSLAEPALDRFLMLSDLSADERWQKLDLGLALAEVALAAGDLAEARRWLRGALDDVSAVSFAPVMNRVYRRVGEIAFVTEPDRGLEIRRQQIAFFEATDDSRFERDIDVARAHLADIRGEHAEAVSFARRAHDRQKSTRIDSSLLAYTGAILGGYLVDNGAAAEAAALVAEVLPNVVSSRSRVALLGVGAAAGAVSGDVELADRCLRELGGDWTVVADPRWIVRLVDTCASVSIAHGRHEQAARLLGAGESYRRALNLERPAAEVSRFAAAADAASTALTEGGFTAAFEAGASAGYDAVLREYFA